MLFIQFDKVSNSNKPKKIKIYVGKNNKNLY